MYMILTHDIYKKSYHRLRLLLEAKIKEKLKKQLKEAQKILLRKSMKKKMIQCLMLLSNINQDKNVTPA